jgi:hypothetical protein
MNQDWILQNMEIRVFSSCINELLETNSAQMLLKHFIIRSIRLLTTFELFPSEARR